MKKLVVLTGSGISAESGLKTFREMGGLWENYDVNEVASIEGWEKDPELVLNFYNERRKQLLSAEPNEGHRILAELEKYFDVHIITQNVDDLHERAGSTKVLHLHGELRKVRSSVDPSDEFVLDGWELKMGDTCKKGSQLRPAVVWFGEPVYALQEAAEITRQADIYVVIGTSLVVYPAAGLVDYVPENIPLYLVDPNTVNTPRYRKVDFIVDKAVNGLKVLKKKLLEQYVDE